MDKIKEIFHKLKITYLLKKTLEIATSGLSLDTFGYLQINEI